MKKVVILFLYFFLSVSNVFAVEAILNYDSYIDLQEDGKVIVTEVIKVNAEGRNIKRGIYRDFPTHYQDQRGFHYNVEFKILSVLRDGQSEAFHTSDRTNGVRVYVGKSNQFLSPGVYTYTIKYQTNRQIGFFKDYDEIYWNVTGNGWSFPILNATATVNLPKQGTQFLQQSAYTGAYGSSNANYEYEVLSDGRAFFKTTKVLNRREGFTIAVAFPKGVIREPSDLEKLQYWIWDNIGAISFILGFIAISFYYIIMWYLYGRDPKSKNIIPRFTPPQGLKAFEVRYLMKMGYDAKVITSLIMDLAIKKIIKIKKNKKDKYVLKLREDAPVASLKPLYKEFVENLFHKRKSVTLQKSYDKKMYLAILKIKKHLEKTIKGTYFKTNLKFTVVGVILSVVNIIVAGIFAFSMNFTLSSFMGLGMSVFFIVIFKFRKQIGCVFYLILPFVFVGLVGVVFAILNTSYQTINIFPLLFLNACFFFLFEKLLKQPTVEGQALRDELKGLKLFMSVADKDEINYTTSEYHLNTEKFEELFPYALALNVEKNWSEKFEKYLQQNEGGASSYHSDWYDPHLMHGMNFAAMTTGLASSLNSSISSSSVAPGSSSGSGGGGFSGGGGGGGGGGGW